MFDSILTTSTDITVAEYITCSVISLALGVLVAFVHSFKNKYSKSMLITLIVLPVVVQTIIMLVNGNIGTGIAIMGAFSLIRFRSQPGNSREIASIFLATTVGLAMAMGFVGISVFLIVIVGAAIMICSSLKFGEPCTARQLRITIPENLEYDGLFDDIFEAYTLSCELVKVKTTNMGSLFELTFDVEFKKGVSQKAFIDEIRCRNGNLNIVLNKVSTPGEEL